MTLGLRVRTLPARAFAFAVSEHAATVRSRPPLFDRAKPRSRLRAARSAFNFTAFAETAAVDAPDLETMEEPLPIAEPPLASTERLLDMSAYASPDRLTMSRPALVPAARPPWLAPLYGAFAALQAADAITTIKALEKPGLREANPIVRPFARNVPAMIVLKGASTVVTVAAVEKLWRKNRAAAVATMVGINVAYGVIVSRNAALQ